MHQMKLHQLRSGTHMMKNSDDKVLNIIRLKVHFQTGLF